MGTSESFAHISTAAVRGLLSTESVELEVDVFLPNGGADQPVLYSGKGQRGQAGPDFERLRNREGVKSARRYWQARKKELIRKVRELEPAMA